MKQLSTYDERRPAVRPLRAADIRLTFELAHRRQERQPRRTAAPATSR